MSVTTSDILATLPELPELPIGSRVRFTAKFTIAGNPLTPSKVSATVALKSMEPVLTSPGEYHVDADMEQLGLLFVNFSTAEGDSKTEIYSVVPASEIESDDDASGDDSTGGDRPSWINSIEDIKAAIARRRGRVATSGIDELREAIRRRRKRMTRISR